MEQERLSVSQNDGNLGFRVEVRFGASGWKQLDVYETYFDACERRRTFLHDHLINPAPDVEFKTMLSFNDIAHVWQVFIGKRRTREEMYCMVRILHPNDNPGKPATEQIEELSNARTVREELVALGVRPN